MARPSKTNKPEIPDKEPVTAESHIASIPVTDNEQNRIISRILRQNRQERTMQKYAAKNRKLKQEVARLEQEIKALQKK